MPQWLVIGLEVGIHWPDRETTVTFRGREILLRPETDRLAPSIVTSYAPPGTHDEALIIARELLSALSWIEQGPIRETMITGGTHPINVGKGTGRMVNPTFRADYLPSSNDPKIKLALAFYREALGVNSVPYQFLGFFKIINILFQKGSEQEDWIRQTCRN